jgi:hypothetical protein
MALKIYDYLPTSLRGFINFSYITFEDLKTNVLTDGKIKPKSYPKTKEYIKPIETIEKKKQTVLEPIMNDLEVQKEDEIIEVQTPIIEQSPINEFKPNYFLSLLAKLPLIMLILLVVLVLYIQFFGGYE